MKMKDATITLRLSEEDKERLREMAEERDISISQLIREICKEIFKEDK